MDSQVRGLLFTLRYPVRSFSSLHSSFPASRLTRSLSRKQHRGQPSQRPASQILPGRRPINTPAPVWSFSMSPSPSQDQSAGSSTGASDPQQAPGGDAGQELPPLSPQEFRIYNRLAEEMDYFVSSPPLAPNLGPRNTVHYLPSSHPD